MECREVKCGRLFHAVGPATEKALEPIRVLVRGTSYSPRAAERRWARPESSDTGVTMSEMYSGEVPITTECMMTQSLYVMRCSIGSQCSSR